ncbi:hypothetical protein F5Y03DRAFT_283224 [Xylaria venustula]|nr:hypothetical protein F5Y03DRAFT_283224 [Xylaria venustula]
MDLKTATTRLRRTFAYPSDATTTSPSSTSAPDSGSDSDGPALDEQEQEELIRALADQNAARNAQFRLFLLALPAISALPYLLVFFGGLSSLLHLSRGGGKTPDGRDTRTSNPITDIWIALLALSSLACTAWTLWSLPPGVTGIRALDTWVGSSNAGASSSTASSVTSTSTYTSRDRSTSGLLGPIGANAQRRRLATSSAAGSRLFFWATRHHRSPLQQYLPFLNIALCSLLILAGILTSSSQRSAASRHWGHVGLANLPALIYAVVLVAKMLMGSIDPERELSSLRYEYKGA